MTWNERVSSFLGLHVDQSADNYRITISARHKIDELFKKVNEGHEHNLQWHPLKAPYSSDFQNAKDYPNTPLSIRQAVLRDKFRFITGVLIYLSITVRADIVTLLGRCCQGTADPTRLHVVWLEKLLCYLHGHRDVGLVFDARTNRIATDVIEPLVLKYPELRDLSKSPYVCFSDANFADVNDPKLRSTTGFIIYVWNSPIIWQSKRQPITAKYF
mmetsp:Transcript_3397/g.11152  ORF Transcript_3397/g.11152 Transcript_3397/m.11152 type:complete len:215 (-) Transcript_3397:650-1294(-)